MRAVFYALCGSKKREIMDKILIICPRDTDRREVARGQLAQKYEVCFADYPTSDLKIMWSDKVGFLGYTFDPAETIKYLIEYVQQNAVTGVFSTENYPGSILAAIVAQECGLIGPYPQAIINHQNKFLSRCFQERLVPEHTPNFALLTDEKSLPDGFSFPLFIKPVKCSFSMLAQRIDSWQQLHAFVRESGLPESHLNTLNWFIEKYNVGAPGKTILLVEELLYGEQCTVEGCIINGETLIIGIVDSIMFPGTISFKRFDYPSSLPEEVQLRMKAITRTLIQYSHYGNGFFNIEFMYDKEQDYIALIEINHRMVYQFADLYEKVDGINTYALMLDFVTGKKIVYRKQKGVYAHAASCVLRFFENKRVLSVPSVADIAYFETLFPDARYQFYAHEGKLLSDARQDGKSFCYGIINLGGESIEDIENKFEESKKLLPFNFEPC